MITTETQEVKTGLNDFLFQNIIYLITYKSKIAW